MWHVRFTTVPFRPLSEVFLLFYARVSRYSIFSQKKGIYPSLIFSHCYKGYRCEWGVLIKCRNTFTVPLNQTMTHFLKICETYFKIYLWTTVNWIYNSYILISIFIISILPGIYSLQLTFESEPCISCLTFIIITH